jgi:hypothetical protein
MSRGAACPDKPPTEADQPHTCCIASCPTPIPPDGTAARDGRPDVQKRAASCMIRASGHDDDTDDMTRILLVYARLP